MKRIFFPLIITLIILSACTPDSLSTPTLSDSSTSQPFETEAVSGVPTVEPSLAALQMALHPPAARTGLPELDPIIDAVLAHDFQALQELTTYTLIGCTNTDGLGGPPKCVSDENEGTIVEVVPFLGPEGHHQRRAEYESWQGPDALGLLAVYLTSAGTYTDPAYPAGQYALVFLLASGVETLTLQVLEGKIIRYDYYYDGLTEADLENKAQEMILPLTFRPVPTPVPWNQFADPAGRFTFVYSPVLEITPDGSENSWLLGNQIRIEILNPETSWIACFDQALGDCPVVESDQQTIVNGQDVRKVEGWIGAVGGNVPQEFLAYIFTLGDKALVFTVYALPFDTEVSDISIVWPLEGMARELFERSVNTIIIND